jgi:methylisocitrate lyase
MRRTTRFRELIEDPEILVLPGVHDALSARIAAEVGYRAITCGGYAATASLLGAPDIAQLSMTEMADLYARLCDCVDLPVLADADTGYGNAVNVARTVRAFEAPASRPCSLKTRWRRSVAVIWRASASFRWRRWWPS